MKIRSIEEILHIKLSWSITDNGQLVWARNTKRGKYIGDAVGLTTLKSKHQNCYLVFNGKLIGYSTGQVAWLLHYGDWPIGEVDHINNDPQDNKKENLRMATRSEQCMNRTAGKADRPNKGVYKRDYGDRWSAQIWVNGVCKNLGTFGSEEEAIKIRQSATKLLHGIFANTKSYGIGVTA